MESKIIIDPAYQYHLQVDGHSWATFVFSDKGDLFINSDWGYWCCSWRAFGSDFKQFLKSMDIHYLWSNLLRQQLQFGGRKTINKQVEQHITVLFKQFQEQL